MDISPDWRFMVGRLLALWAITDDDTCPCEREWVSEQFCRIAEHLDSLQGTHHSLELPSVQEFRRAESAALSA